jgi:hypothetical protein
VIGDRRAPEAPPVDSLAECIVLNHLLLNRELIESTDLGPCLIFPEHRDIWQAMRTVQQRTPDLSFGAFYLALIDELERAHPGQGFALVELLRVGDTELERGWDEYRRANRDDLGRRDFHHGFEWWLARLRRISDARQVIRAAHEAAERAWREDVDGALQALRTAPQPRDRVIGVDLLEA